MAAGGAAAAAVQGYLTSYKGLAFSTESETALRLPAGAEVVAAKSIWAPG